MFDAAVRSLSGAPRSRKSLEERLTSAGYPEAHVRAAVARLVEIGLIDDERYAQAILDSRDRSRPRGDRALLQELLRRGVDEDLAHGLLERRAAGGHERTDLPGREPVPAAGDQSVGVEERAARVALAKLRLRGGDPRVEVQRLAQGLARRGFPSALCWRLARERVAEQANVDLASEDLDGE
ncbi:MAG: recombination regulator RecX [Chloroflexi bacterium]|nr:recombination regulator RecX [Chloroflexota bacterium]